MPSDTTILGSQAEQAACRWLGERGFRILDRNWRRPWGELDIIAQKDSVLRFIEVKASKHAHPGLEPFIRADGRKMAKVLRTARTWLAAHGISPQSEWQMDIISVIMNQSEPVFEHFENI